ncbi:hypothetical protein SNEBB_001335 [Seison nebaliae]|nr:hypothetical protein SNEBB_001335 [Seison nebaliae]
MNKGIIENAETVHSSFRTAMTFAANQPSIALYHLQEHMRKNLPSAQKVLDETDSINYSSVLSLIDEQTHNIGRLSRAQIILGDCKDKLKETIKNDN